MMTISNEKNMPEIPVREMGDVIPAKQIDFWFPREFFFDAKYQNLPIEAEWLYAVMLYRSRRTAAIKGCVPAGVSFSYDEIMGILHAGIYTAHARLRQLENFGLVRMDRGEECSEDRFYVQDLVNLHFQ